MQAHDGSQLDLSVQVAKVRAKTRPWKSIIALVFAIAAAGTSVWAHGHFRHYLSDDVGLHQLIAAVTAIAFCLFACAGVIGLSSQARSVLEPMVGLSHAAVVRYALVLFGLIVTLIVTLNLFGVPVGQLLLGGALTTVFVSIAAQQALGNVFSGLVLLLARPFNVGDAIRLRAGALSGEIDGTVTEIGITYLRLSTINGILSVPNSQVLAAAVGPLPQDNYPPPPPPAAPVIWPTPPGYPAPGATAPAYAPAPGAAPATGPAAASGPAAAAAVELGLTPHHPNPAAAPPAPGSPAGSPGEPGGGHHSPDGGGRPQDAPPSR